MLRTGSPHSGGRPSRVRAGGREKAQARRHDLLHPSVAQLSVITMLSSLGFERIDEHAQHLATHFVERAPELGWLPFRPLCDPSAASHIVPCATPTTIRR
jgi:hypothetical protein